MIGQSDSLLASLPEGWRSFRIKDITELSPGFSSKAPQSTDLCTVVPMESVSVKGQIDTITIVEYDLISGGLPNFEVGDVIFAKITPCMENGKGAYVESLPTRYAFGSTEFHVLRPGFKVNSKFLYYYTYNSVFREYAAGNMTGAAGQKRVSSRFLNYTRIFLPSIPEQRRIASYLDKTCAAIDTAIEKKQKQLETLDALRKSIIYKAVTRGLDDSVELKDSGVEWIGKIPVTWKVTRLKNLARIRYGLGQPPQEQEDGIPMIRATNIDAGHILEGGLLRVDPDALPLEREPYLQEDDIIVVRSGAYTCDSAIIPRKYSGAVAGYDMVVTVNKADPKFISYTLLSSYALDGQLLLMTLRAAQPHLNAEELGSIIIVLPKTMKEQQEIALHIKNKLKQIDKVQTNLSAQVVTLQVYRKSLIHECVTGKRRITEDDLKEQNA